MQKLFFAFVTFVIANCAADNSWRNDFNVSTIVETFHNPILDFVSPDPQVLYLNGFYYMVLSSNIWPYVNGGILVYKSKTLTDFRASPVKMVYHVPTGMANLWAPELHAIRGDLYIYFAMDDGNNNNHRMYVIKANDADDPMGNWGEAKRMYTRDIVDYWAIDGTIFEYSNRLYFIWSGWPDVDVGSPQNLYIAEMCDPETICSERILLREPKFAFEGPFTLEGPYILQRNGRVFLVFSAHSTWGPDYCLGIMGLDNMLDPMNSNNWWHNNDGCVFYRNDEQNVFCTGHAAFTTSPDGLETWIIFHATNDVNDPGRNRVARIEKLEWDSTNNPIFPRPSGNSVALAVPSGQVQETYVNPIIDGLSADPSAILIGGWYYFLTSTNGERELTILKSRWLTNFRESERSIAYVAPSEYSNVWAAEMHTVSGELYIYFTQEKIGESHRNYVIKAVDPNDPMAGWSTPTRLMPEDNHFSIDGTILQYGNGRLYYIYCSVDDGVPMSLYIAPMSDPMTISGPRVLLRSPHSEWDTHGGPVNEGPFIVQNADRVFLVFSGSSTWTPDYCLSMMGIDNLKDPLIRSNWWDDLDRCLFFKNDEEGIYCTGHASFTTSPDGTETWMLYHATDDPNSNEFSTRIARADRIIWAEDHAPIFPRPTNQRGPVPSGHYNPETETTTEFETTTETESVTTTETESTTETETETTTENENNGANSPCVPYLLFFFVFLLFSQC